MLVRQVFVVDAQKVEDGSVEVVLSQYGRASLKLVREKQ